MQIIMDFLSKQGGGGGENAIFHNRKFQTGFKSLICTFVQSLLCSFVHLHIYSFAHLDLVAADCIKVSETYSMEPPSLQFSLEQTDILDSTSNLSKVV